MDVLYPSQLPDLLHTTPTVSSIGRSRGAEDSGHPAKANGQPGGLAGPFPLPFRSPPVNPFLQHAAAGGGRFPMPGLPLDYLRNIGILSGGTAGVPPGAGHHPTFPGIIPVLGLPASPQMQNQNFPGFSPPGVPRSEAGKSYDDDVGQSKCDGRICLEDFVCSTFVNFCIEGLADFVQLVNLY